MGYDDLPKKKLRKRSIKCLSGVVQIQPQIHIPFYINTILNLNIKFSRKPIRSVFLICLSRGPSKICSVLYQNDIYFAS